MLKALSDRVDVALGEIPGLRDIDNPFAFDRVDMDLGLDAAKASLLGVAPGEARRAVRLAISGEQASRLRDSEGDTWPVTVRLPMTTNQPVSALSDIYVPTLAGGSIPLLEIASPTLKSVPPLITRYKLQRTVTITAYNQPGVLTSKLNGLVSERLARIDLPPGYSFGIGGEAEAARRNFSRPRPDHSAGDLRHLRRARARIRPFPRNDGGGGRHPRSARWVGSSRCC